jgi:hypothetical protein
MRITLKTLVPITVKKFTEGKNTGSAIAADIKS